MGDSTKEAHIRQAVKSARMNGRHKEADELEEYLAGPEGDEDPPEDCDFVWNTFCELNARRAVGVGMGGIVLSPITHESIQSFAHGFGLDLTPWELSALSLLDDLYLDSQRKQMVAQRASNK